MTGSTKKRLEWARSAQAAYEATLARIGEEDAHTAALVEARVARVLALKRVGRTRIVTARKMCRLLKLP